jgi:predicted polyphosphate/ATP-dependent NAD kinase
MTDPGFLERKYAVQGAQDVTVTAQDGPDGPRIVSRRKVTVELPSFAKKVMSPANTVVQTDEWQPAAADGRRVCRYTVEVQGVPSRIDGTVTLTADGDGTRQDVEADVKVSIPLLGGKLEKFAADSGRKVLAEEAKFTDAALASG